jgi:threonine dehydrogenase-like Zn-dependent dehydrogenase
MRGSVHERDSADARLGRRPSGTGDRPAAGAGPASGPRAGTGAGAVRVLVCGVGRTDLHLAEGDLPPKRHAVTPGHEVVGWVDVLGPQATRFRVGERIGVAWLGSTRYQAADAPRCLSLRRRARCQAGGPVGG